MRRFVFPGGSSLALAAVLTLGSCGGPARSGTTPVGPTSATPAAGAAPAPAPASRTLFERLGGKPAIEAVVGAFVGRLAADPRVKFRFVNSNIPTLTRDLVDFVCLATGGPCAYQGREMGVLHARMHVSKVEWDATVEALVGALDQFKVGATEKGELLGAIGPLEGQIVDPPKDPPTGAELAAIDAAGKDLARFGTTEELLGAAFDALRLGNRSYADQLFSLAEVELGAKALAALAPRFRAGSPPRITTAPTQLPLDTPPQPREAVGSSDDDAAGKAPKAGGASLSGTLRLRTVDPVDAFGIVMLTPVDGAGKRARRRTPKQRTVEQRERSFAPRLIAVPVGSTIAFPNFDDIYHNVFSRSASQPFDLGLFRNGQARALTFTRPGIVRVGCNLHANMATSIVVVDAPHYVVTDAKGAFRFANLAPGRYAARAWTERSSEPIESVVVIKAGENTLALDATNDAAPGMAEDKFGAPRASRP